LIGVHPVPGEISYVVAGLDDEPLDKVTHPLPHRSELAAEMQAGIAELVAKVGRRMDEVRAVGMSVPGLVGRDGHLAHSPNLGWRDLQLRNLLDSSIRQPLYIDNNCNADAMAEYLFGSGVDDETFVYLDSSSGVGAGLFLDGALYRGRGGYAGEFGHTKIVPNGRLCRCGNCGCLSAYVSDFAIAKRLQQDGGQVSSTDELLSLAEAGNELVLQVLSEVGSFLGIGASNLINNVQSTSHHPWWKPLPSRSLYPPFDDPHRRGAGTSCRAGRVQDRILGAQPAQRPFGRCGPGARGLHQFVRRQEDYYLSHEYLEPFNSPCYFQDFVERAGGYGLCYLAEAQPSTMFASNYGEGVAEPLLQECGHSQVLIEQYLDFIVNRTFRQTLLVHHERAEDIRYRLDGERLRDLHFAASFSSVEGDTRIVESA